MRTQGPRSRWRVATVEQDDPQPVNVGDVFTEHQRFIESVARRHAADRDVEDIVQVVGMKLCRKLDTFQGRAQLRTWLYRVTVNAARDHFRAETRQTRVVEAMLATPEPDLVLDPDLELQRRDRGAALREAMQRLRPNHRDSIMDHLRPRAVLSDRKSVRHVARQRLRDMLRHDPRIMG